MGVPLRGEAPLLETHRGFRLRLRRVTRRPRVARRRCHDGLSRCRVRSWPNLGRVGRPLPAPRAGGRTRQPWGGPRRRGGAAPHLESSPPLEGRRWHHHPYHCWAGERRTRAQRVRALDHGVEGAGKEGVRRPRPLAPASSSVGDGGAAADTPWTHLPPLAAGRPPLRPLRRVALPCRGRQGRSATAAPAPAARPTRETSSTGCRL